MVNKFSHYHHHKFSHPGIAPEFNINLYRAEVPADGTCLIHSILYATDPLYRDLSGKNQEKAGNKKREDLANDILAALTITDEEDRRFIALRDLNMTLHNDTPDNNDQCEYDTNINHIENRIKKFVDCEIMQTNAAGEKRYLGQYMWRILEDFFDPVQKYQFMIYHNGQLPFYCDGGSDIKQDAKWIMLLSRGKIHYEPLFIKRNNEDVYVFNYNDEDILDLDNLRTISCLFDSHDRKDKILEVKAEHGIKSQLYIDKVDQYEEKKLKHDADLKLLLKKRETVTLDTNDTDNATDDDNDEDFSGTEVFKSEDSDDEGDAITDELIIERTVMFLRTADMQATTERQIRKSVEADLSTDLTEQKLLVRSVINRFLADPEQFKDVGKNSKNSKNSKAESDDSEDDDSDNDDDSDDNDDEDDGGDDNDQSRVIYENLTTQSEKDESDDEEQEFPVFDNVDVRSGERHETYYDIPEGNIKFTKKSQINVLKHNYEILDFTEDQSISLIYDLTKNSDTLSLLKELEFFNKPELTRFQQLCTKKWFIPIVDFTKIYTRLGFESADEFLDADDIKPHQQQESLGDYTKTLRKDLVRVFKPVYNGVDNSVEGKQKRDDGEDKEQREQIFQDTTSMWHESITERYKEEILDKYITLHAEPQRNSDPDWNSGYTKMYKNNLWTNSITPTKPNLSFEFKRISKERAYRSSRYFIKSKEDEKINETINVKGFFINNNVSTKSYSIFDCDKYIDAIQSANTFASVTLYTNLNDESSGTITKINNNMMYIELTDELRCEYDTNLHTVKYYNNNIEQLVQSRLFIIYINNVQYDYKYIPNDFYSKNIIFSSTQNQINDFIDVFIPDTTDFIQNLTNTETTYRFLEEINVDLNKYHFTTVQTLKESDFKLLKSLTIFQEEENDYDHKYTGVISSSFITKEIFKPELSILKFEELEAEQQYYNFGSLDTHVVRLNHLFNLKDKGLRIIHYSTRNKQLMNIENYNIRESNTKSRALFAQKNIFNVDYVQKYKTNNTSGKTNYDDFNNTKNNLQSNDTIARDFIHDGIKFYEKKHQSLIKHIAHTEINNNNKIYDDESETVTDTFEYDLIPRPEIYGYQELTLMSEDQKNTDLRLLGMKTTPENAIHIHSMIKTTEQSDTNRKITHNSKTAPNIPDSRKWLNAITPKINTFACALIYFQIIGPGSIDENFIETRQRKTFSFSGFPMAYLNENNQLPTSVNKQFEQNSVCRHVIQQLYNNHIAKEDMPKPKDSTGKANLYLLTAGVLINEIRRLMDIPWILKKLLDKKYEKIEDKNVVLTSAVKQFKPFSQNQSDLNEISKSKSEESIVNLFTARKKIISVSSTNKDAKSFNNVNKTIIKQPHVLSKNLHTLKSSETIDYIAAFLKANRPMMSAQNLNMISEYLYPDKAVFEIPKFINTFMQKQRLIHTILPESLTQLYVDEILNKSNHTDESVLKIIESLSSFNFVKYFNYTMRTNETMKNEIYRVELPVSVKYRFLQSRAIKLLLTKRRVLNIEYLIKAPLASPSDKIKVLLYILLQTIAEIRTKYLKELTMIDQQNQEKYMIELNNNIKNVLSLMMSEKAIIDKQELTDKFNTLKSDERAHTRKMLLSMTQDELQVYLARKKEKLVPKSEENTRKNTTDLASRNAAAQNESQPSA